PSTTADTSPAHPARTQETPWRWQGVSSSLCALVPADGRLRARHAPADQPAPCGPATHLRTRARPRPARIVPGSRPPAWAARQRVDRTAMHAVVVLDGIALAHPVLEAADHLADRVAQFRELQSSLRPGIAARAPAVHDDIRALGDLRRSAL